MTKFIGTCNFCRKKMQLTFAEIDRKGKAWYYCKNCAKEVQKETQ